jgi:hypothetical protein
MVITQNSDKPIFSFIIINFNAYDYTASCLRSIKLFCTNYPYELIVIDNASSDDSMTKLEQEFAGAIFQKNEENFGFARACNQGIDFASGEFLIFLNNDFEFTSDIFDSIIDKFKRYENLGLLGFQLLNPDGSYQKTAFIFPSVFRRILQLTLVSFLKKFQKLHYGLPMEKDQVVDYVSGALMIIPAALVHQLQLRFDEHFFMYHEEMDLAFQLRRHGKICLLDSTPAGIHYGQNLEDVSNERVFLLRQKNYLYFFQKNYGRISLFALIAVNVIIFIMKWLFAFRNSSHRNLYRKVIQYSLAYL